MYAFLAFAPPPVNEQGGAKEQASGVGHCRRSQSKSLGGACARIQPHLQGVAAGVRGHAPYPNGVSEWGREAHGKGEMGAVSQGIGRVQGADVGQGAPVAVAPITVLGCLGL
jgi:hypothetical protein